MKPKRGETPGGQSFDPEALVEDLENSDARPKPAPAPGLPVSQEEFERLKEAAKRGPPSGEGHAQEDRQ